MRTIVELFAQHNEQVKSELLCIEVHIEYWLLNKGRVSNACVGGFGDQTMSLEVGNIES